MKNPMANRKGAWNLLVLVILWAMIFPVLVGANPEELRNQAQLYSMGSGPAQSSYGLLELSDEVLGQTREKNPDLRLYRGNQEVPYAIIPGNASSVGNRLRAEMFNQGQNSVGDQVVEVKVPEKQWVNGLVLRILNQDFIRKVKIEGSMDQKEWLILQPESTVFDLTNEQKSRNTEVTFPKTNLSFLRISLINEGRTPLRWEGVDFFLLDPKESVLEKKERAFEQRLTDEKGVQEIFMELTYPNLPVEELEVITEDQNFSRKVELFGSQTGERWDLLTSSELYDYKLDKASAQNRKLNFQGRLKIYKLKIYNQDNRPLQIQEIKLKGTNPALVFPQSGQGSLILHWGSKEMRAPEYDLEKLLPNLDYSKMNRYGLKQGEQNPEYKEVDLRPWTERHSWLLNSALVLLVLALLGIIVKSVKKVNP